MTTDTTEKPLDIVCTIPATGYLIIPFDRYEGTVDNPEPILAFAFIKGEAEAGPKFRYTCRPITVDGLFGYGRLGGLDNDYAVLRPDGRIEIPGEETFDNIHQFVKAVAAHAPMERQAAKEADEEWKAEDEAKAKHAEVGQ